MTTIASEANYAEWLKQVEDDPRYYKEMADWYPFRMAYDQGMKPSKAVKDCKEWLEG